MYIYTAALFGVKNCNFCSSGPSSGGKWIHILILQKVIKIIISNSTFFNSKWNIKNMHVYMISIYYYFLN